MKKTITAILAALFCLSLTVFAVPAKPGKMLVTQPDGSTVTIQVHGDEWFHYVTDADGNFLEENSEGYWVKSTTMTKETVAAAMAKAKAELQSILELRQEVLAKASSNTGSPYIPVVLVQFSDKSFSISDPKSAFTKLLNEEGYSDNGGTGSVLDYYTDQSRGAFTPQFVVMDVVTLSGSVSTYGSTDTYAAKALYEACQSLDSSVDFSKFDNDGDGYIDMTLMYYAGYNEAEGASSSTIWPHQYYVPSVVTGASSFDGVYLNRYFCTSELKGYSGSNMCGIGTTCHEFAHSLGLPDFYDTNYNEYGDGTAGATYSYDLMCSGPYNNNGCTPPWMSAEELVMLGWMDSITELTSTGSVTIPSIAATTPVAYKTSTSTDGEYFVYECRPGTSWDAPLQPGMIVYHVDKSNDHKITYNTSKSTTKTVTAYNLWANWTSTNAINCLGSHPCYYIVPAADQDNLNYSGSETNLPFPGKSSVTTYTPVDWSGSETGFTASGISYNSTTQEVTFNLVNSNSCGISGLVMDSDGVAIKGAVVTLSASSSSSSVSSSSGSMGDLMRDVSVLKAGSDILQTATTDETGAYSFSFDDSGTYVVEASADGYVSKSATVEVSRVMTQNFYLLREGEEAPSEIYIYPEDAEWGDYGNSSYSSWSLMCANYFPTSMMSAYAGKQIKSISFAFAGETDTEGETTTTGNVYALIDFGSERQICIQAENPVANDWTTVDLTDYDLFVPEGKDIFAGYALEDWAYSYPITATTPASSELVGYMADFDLDSTEWEAWSYVFKIKITIGDYTTPDNGYNYIYNPRGGIYSIGDTFALTLVETTGVRVPEGNISWYYDDEPVSGESIILSKAGTHTVTARFKTSEGNTKVVELEITVE